MQPNIKQLPTNWTDGMKINRQHFIDSENAVFAAIHDSIAVQINNYNYGLLTSGEDIKSSLDVNIVKSQADNFLVKVTLCRAITSGGVRIELTPTLTKEIILNEKVNLGSLKNNPNPQFYLIISVDYNERTPSGNPIANEYPARHPFVLPKYQLHLKEASELNNADLGKNFLTIGRFKYKGDELQWDANYIPPCTSIQSFQNLKQHYNTVANHFNSIQTCTYSIIQKVINKNQNSPLAFNVKYVCEKLVYYVSSQFFPFRFTLHQQSPIAIVYSVVQLANHFKMALDFLPEKEKEDLQLYFKEWNEISPGKFDEILAAVIETDYDHENILECLKPLIEFTELTADLFEKLNDLELIGRRKEKDIFVREIQGNTKQGPKKKGFSMLD
jgi:hypothetical protein